MEPLVEERATVFGHDLLLLLQKMGGKVRTEALRNAAAGAFGPEVVFLNCHGDRFTFDEVLAFFSSKGKIVHRGDDVLLGSVPACPGH